MTAYDRIRFDLPAPLAHVTLRDVETGAVLSQVPMLLDTGADVSLIPHTSANELGAAVIPDKSYELAGFNGKTTIVPVVRLELLFLNRTFRGQFLLINQEWGILGRNILNSVSLLLHGPHLFWREQRSS